MVRVLNVLVYEQLYHAKYGVIGTKYENHAVIIDGDQKKIDHMEKIIDARFEKFTFQ